MQLTLFVNNSCFAYLRYFGEAVPKSFWKLPKFIGNKNQMIPTVLFFAAFTGAVSVVFSAQMKYLLGLSMELTRFSILLSLLYAVHNLLPKKLQELFDVEKVKEVEVEIEEEEEEETTKKEAIRKRYTKKTK